MSVNNLLNAWNDKNMGIDCYTYNLIFYPKWILS